MLLRFESKFGQFRLNVEPSDTFGALQSRVGRQRPQQLPRGTDPIQILANLAPNADPSSVILSNKPVSSTANTERERRLADLPKVQVQQVGLK